MFCTNCGHEMRENEEFCSECGLNNTFQNSNNEQTNSVCYEETLSRHLAKNNPLKPLINKIKNLIIKYKKQCFYIIIVLIIVFIVVVLFNFLFGFSRLSWDKSYNDFKLKYVTQSEVKLGIKFSNKKKLSDVKVKTTCGNTKINNLEVIWNLDKEMGKCRITVSYKMQKIKKEYSVIPLDINNKELFLDYEVDDNSLEDLDYDLLTNKQEKEYKTNPLLSDSDMDSINDYEEIFTYKTDPNKKDTDEDGLNDYDEIELGLDPLKSDSKGDGIKDGKRLLTYNYQSDKIKMTIKGSGNIASTVANVSSDTKISNKKGLINHLFSFYTSGEISEANVSINYTDEELKENGLNEDNLSIYYYDEENLKYEKIDTIVDKENKTLTATLKHFSNYVVGDSSLIKEKVTNQVLFILDNSWSMYTDEQYKKITGEDYSNGLFGGLDGFDAAGLRFTLTSNLISKLSSKDYQIGLSEFRSDYANALKIGSDEKKLKEKLKTMNGNFITQSAGTNITNALARGMFEFTEESDNKFIVILTDGQDSSLSNNEKGIVEKALSNNVKICSIGFGSGTNNIELSNISNGTGCNFYSSSNAEGLTELFDNIGVELKDNLVDIDGDDKEDGILVADSGFVVNRDGFSFSNYGTNLSSGGHCYGMATFAELYYKKKLPLNVSEKTAKSDTSYPYNLNNTYFKNYSNLYDYKLKTNALKYSFGFHIFDEEAPSDLKIVENDSLIYNHKYKEEIENSGIYEFKEAEKSSVDSDTQMKNYGFTYKTYENILLNEDKMQTSKNFNNDDRQMFNAIYTGFIKQHVTTNYSSGTDFILFLRNIVGTEATSYRGGAGFINVLKARLDDKDAPVISSSFSGGLHAINAISLVQDADNPNYYYIGVYDNNYPGEKRYVDIECNAKTCVTKANSYYKSSNEPIRITPSLEYDLEYYNN